MSTLQDLVTPRPLKRVELWLAWGTKMIPYHDTKPYEECVLPNAAMTAPSDTSPPLYPAVRVTYDPTPPGEIFIAHSSRAALLALVSEAYIFQPIGGKKATTSSDRKIKEKRCRVFLHEYVWNRFEIPSLEEKISMAEEIKKEANKACTAGDWLEALHGYAKAWATLLPYHREALSKDDPSRQVLINFENTIFVNLMAAVVTGLKDIDAKLKDSEKKELCGIGLRAAAIPLNRWDAMTVGLMRKTCIRLLNIQTTLAKIAPGHPARLDATYIKAVNQVIRNLTAEPPSPQSPILHKVRASAQGANSSTAPAPTPKSAVQAKVPAGWDDSKVHPNDINPIMGLWTQIMGNVLEKKGQEEGRKWTLGLSGSSMVRIVRKEDEQEDVD
ncbi:hypothetical protein I317_05106 [Kwoniella heveanensis CBS 569]|nr:hypothetical protein I317_05106 [Kwoniella heveanensis CBS 569]